MRDGIQQNTDVATPESVDVMGSLMAGSDVPRGGTWFSTPRSRVEGANLMQSAAQKAGLPADYLRKLCDEVGASYDQFVADAGHITAAQMCSIYHRLNDEVNRKAAE